MATIHIYTFPSLPNLTAHTTKCNLILKVEQPIFCLSLTFLHDYFLYDLVLDYLLLSTFIFLLVFSYATFVVVATVLLHYIFGSVRSSNNHPNLLVTHPPTFSDVGASWCKMMQDGARWCKMVQDGAR